VLGHKTANVLDITGDTMKITAPRNDDLIILPGYISVDLDTVGDWVFNFEIKVTTKSVSYDKRGCTCPATPEGLRGLISLYTILGRVSSS